MTLSADALKHDALRAIHASAKERRERMMSGIAIRPKQPPIIRTFERAGCRVVVRGHVSDGIAAPGARQPEPTRWAARARWRAIVASLPDRLRNDRPLAKRIVRELWRHDCTWAEMTGPRGAASIANTRQHLVRIIHEARPHLSLPQLGHLFGGRDHTTILHALRKTGCRQ